MPLHSFQEDRLKCLEHNIPRVDEHINFFESALNNLIYPQIRKKYTLDLRQQKVKLATYQNEYKELLSKKINLSS